MIAGSTTPLSPTPIVLAESFKEGPTKVRPPNKEAPSPANFNLFLKRAAARSLPLNPSRLSRLDLAKALRIGLCHLP